MNILNNHGELGEFRMLAKTLYENCGGQVLGFAVIVTMCYLGLVSFLDTWNYWTIAGAVYYGCIILVLSFQQWKQKK